MGNKVVTPQQKPLITRFETRKKIWETPVSLSTTQNGESMMEPEKDEQNRMQGAKARRESLAIRKRKKLKKKDSNVVRIDVKTPQTRQSSLHSRKSLSGEMPSLRIETTTALFPLSPGTLKPHSMRHIRNFSDHPSDSVFVGDLERTHAPQVSEPCKKSTYKLIKSSRCSASMELCSSEGPQWKTFSTSSLLQVVKASVEEAPAYRKLPVKHLRTSSGEVPVKPFAPRASLEIDSKGAYLIKTKKSSLTPYTASKRYAEERSIEKSRAERLWAWKGKKGVLNSPNT